ncbi:hypothetical protein TH61_08940 [Rufibacter sp. DG15C]|uniref:hypothetical protein n=1 Tax=Rufibacter sp. DG15C TaxID=1379909 RepID=UPI00078C9ABC|nr:hypothetical protein [Rufibacter sp. DG15C]AMM51272.1 hypothetical protein TH61_08940 [Rufibacter sp. DG15C]
MAPRSNFDDEFGYDEDDFNSSHLDDEFSFDDDDEVGGTGRIGYAGEEDEEVNLPYEGELFNEMLSKLHGTLIMFGEDDPAMMDLQAELLKMDTDKGVEVDDMFYLEEASLISKVLKKHSATSPRIQEIYTNYMKDIVRFSDESDAGYPGDYYLEEQE